MFFFKELVYLYFSFLLFFNVCQIFISLLVIYVVAMHVLYV